jgi:membrane associated rhomboid family serine protease
MPGVDDAEVAWQAHIGGFVAGLLLFALFDPVPRRRLA